MKTKCIHFLNERFVEEKDLVVSVNDLGFTRGYAVFDFFVTYNGRPFMLGPHIDRLFNSASLIELSIPHSKKEIKDLVFETLRRSENGKEKAIKIIVSGGESHNLLPEGDSTVIISCNDRKLCPSNWYKEGVKVVTVKHSRYNPLAKTNNYIEAIKQLQIGEKFGVNEPIYYDDRQVFEGSNSNIFIVIDGILKTPKTNILEGITRKTIIENLKLDTPVIVEDFPVEILRKADEVFITGSNKEILPIVFINKNKVGNAKVGSVTKEVMSGFKNYVQSDKWH